MKLRRLFVLPSLFLPLFAAEPASPSDATPPPAPLSRATLAHLAQMTPLFDGRTLAGWLQAPPYALTLGREDIKDFPGLAKKLAAKSDPVSAWLAEQLDDAGKAGVAATPASTDAKQTSSPVLRNLNRLINAESSLYDATRFAGVSVRPETTALREKNPRGPELARLNRLLLEDAFPNEIIRSAPSAWIVKDGAMASTGGGRGVIYSAQDFTHYRLVFSVRQITGNHQPGILIFCQRPPAGERGADALAGIQFQVPNGGHWDYRAGRNKAGEDVFTRPVRTKYDNKQWAQVEILVDARAGTARMAVAQPVGTRAIENLVFKDPAADKTGPIAWQMHNAGLFDEYKDVRIEIDPKDDRLITVE